MAQRKTSSRRRKSGKFTPLVWIATGALIAIFISYSGGFFKTNGKKNLSLQQRVQGLTNFIPGHAENKTSEQTPKQKSTQSKRDYYIYLAVQDNDNVRLVPVKIALRDPQHPLKDLLEQLIQKPSDNNHLNLVPFRTKIHSIKIKNHTAIIDFNDAFGINSYGRLGQRVQIYQIVYTATQFKDINAVTFTIDGKIVTYLGGDGVLIHNPVTPFSYLPSFSEEE